MRRLIAPAACLTLLSACGGSDGEIAFTFTDETTHANATSIAVTVFEPLIQTDTSELEVVTCDRVGVFPPARTINPENLRQGSAIGRLIGELRKSQTYPLDGDLDIDFTAIPEGDQTNPWGAAMVYVEARAAVHSTDPDNGAPIATLAAGCTCIRSRDAHGANNNLNNRIRELCPTLEEKPERTIALAPVMPKGFRITPCVDACATSIEGGPLGGVSACIERVACESRGSADCFECDPVDCPERDDFSNVPIIFETSEGSEVLLSEKDGRINSRLSLGSCTNGQPISARVVGRPEPDFSQKLACVPSIEAFDCTNFGLPSDGKIVAVSALDRTGVAILSDTEAGARLSVFDPRGQTMSIMLELPDRQPMGLDAFFLNASARNRSLLAVATTTTASILETLRLDLYDWFPDMIAHAVALSAVCPNNNCAADVCTMGARANSTASLSHADIDGDGLNDIAVAGDGGTAVVVGFLSGRTGGPDLYSSTGCTCGQYGGTSASSIVVGDFGGTLGGAIDVLIGSTVGPTIQFGDADSRLPTCGGPVPIAGASLVRDLTRGRFGCDPNGSPERICGTCGHGIDAVIVGGELSGFLSPGVSVVLAKDTNEDQRYRQRSTLVVSNDTEEGRGPTEAAAGDFNHDGFDDLAVVYSASGEVRVWLGARNGAVAESPAHVMDNDCPGAKMVVADLDGDAVSEIVLVCTARPDPVLERCVPRLTQP